MLAKRARPSLKLNNKDGRRHLTQPQRAAMAKVLQIGIRTVPSGFEAKSASDRCRAFALRRNRFTAAITENAMRFASDITCRRAGALLMRFKGPGLMPFHCAAKRCDRLGPIELLLANGKRRP